MSCDCDSCCSNNCCPEVVPVTINQNTYSLDGSNLSLTVTQVDASNATLLIQVQDSDGVDVAGNYQLELWFVDSNSAVANETVLPPTTPGVSRMKIVTAADGSYTLSVSNVALDTWYVCVDNNAGVTVSDAITVGV